MASENNIAIWVITEGGVCLANQIKKGFPECHIFLPVKLNHARLPGVHKRFVSMKNELAQAFSDYYGHIFIMAAGIVIRMIAPLIRDKTVDPAVVALDDQGRFSISLLSGHIGGGNRLAGEVAGIVGSIPVITTATDANHIPAIDLFAVENNLSIENPGAIKIISMAMLNHEPIYLFDPYEIMGKKPGIRDFFLPTEPPPRISQRPAVFIDDRITDQDPDILILRPKTLSVGIGCNRNTTAQEIKEFLKVTLEDISLSIDSIQYLASVDLKKDEKGLMDLAEKWDLPIRFYSTEELKRVENIKNPSGMVEKHIGVKSVCEASAILASNKGKLILPKKKQGNVTLAVARTASIL